MASKLEMVEDIVCRVQKLEGDELCMMHELLNRLDRGRTDYGPWKVDDGRDNPAEALEEIMDALHYCAAELVRLRK